MTNTIKADGWADVPLEKAFEWVADSTNTTEWFYGVTKFAPKTELTRGLGSTYDVVLNIGMPVKAVVECVEFVENDYFLMRSTSGPSHESRWAFTEENGGTHMYGEFSYTLPGGLAGKAMGKLAGPFIKVAVDKTTKNLVEKAGRA